jgi:hypothetical protein
VRDGPERRTILKRECGGVFMGRDAKRNSEPYSNILIERISRRFLINMKLMTFNQLQVTSCKLPVTSNQRPATNDSIAPMCLECVERANCPGKTRAEVESGKKPCGKYNLDYALLGIKENESVESVKSVVKDEC